MLKLLDFGDVASAKMSLNDVIFLKIFEFHENCPKQGMYHFPWCSFNFSMEKYPSPEETHEKTKISKIRQENDEI